MAKRPSFERSADTQALVDYFAQHAEPGKTLTYEELSEVIGCNVRTRYWCLASAMRVARSELHIVMRAVRSVGVAVLDDHQIPRLGADATKRQVRASKRVLRDLAQVRNYDQLTADEQQQLTLHRGLHGLIAYSGKKSVQERIGKLASGVSKTIPMTKLLEALRD